MSLVAHNLIQSKGGTELVQLIARLHVLVQICSNMGELTFAQSCFSLIRRGPSALCLTILTKAQGLDGEACVAVKIVTIQMW